MKERPIIFSGPMVRAILAGSKTQTRRVIHLPDNAEVDTVTGTYTFYNEQVGQKTETCSLPKCLYGQPGDRLWVRETWAAPHRLDHMPPRVISENATFHYAATEERGGLFWRPSIHMPRKASRITLEVVSVRAERVQDISINDAIAESILEDYHGWRSEATNVFEKYWDSLNAKRGHSWASNPWVWAIEFKRVEEGE